MYKTKSTLDYKRGHGATTNDPDAIDYATSIVEKYLGKDAVVHPEHPSMAAEDFSAYLHKIKGAFLWLELVLKAIHHFIMQGLPLMKRF